MAFRNSIKHPECFNIISGRTNIAEYHESIQESIRLLLLTNKGELLGDPQYGTNLIKHIHEPNTMILQDLLSDDISRVISKYEKRIRVNPNDITFIKENKKLYINIMYTVIRTNEVDTFTLELLKEVSQYVNQS